VVLVSSESSELTDLKRFQGRRNFMAFELTRKDSVEWDAHVDKIREIENRVDEAVRHFNSEVARLRDELMEPVNELNSALDDAETFVQGIAEDWRGTFDERSEAWQEKDEGIDADQKITELENFELTRYQLEDESSEQTVIDDSQASEMEDAKPKE
jgi:uncharacterized coiled-coil DUF342 family protein